MASLNKVFLIGNLTRDPELRRTPNGAVVVELGLAVNRTYTTSSGETRDDTAFLDIVVWGRQAETCAQYLQKGSPLLVEGRLQYDSWEDQQTGQKRSKIRIVAERTQFLGRPKGAEYQDVGGPEPRQSVSEGHGMDDPRDSNAGGGYGSSGSPAYDRPRQAPNPGRPPMVGPEDVVSEEEDNIPF
jgi:single-strand DNA-binding protein